LCCQGDLGVINRPGCFRLEPLDAVYTPTIPE
jgi:hypothetical protein